jgi:hypothetical protein
MALFYAELEKQKTPSPQGNEEKSSTSHHDAKLTSHGRRSIPFVYFAKTEEFGIGKNRKGI